MLYGPMGRFLDGFLDVVWSDGSFFGCCMVRWVVFWMLYGPMGRFLDVVWYDLNITKNHQGCQLSSSPTQCFPRRTENSLPIS